MAAATFEDWIPEEFDSQVIQKVNATSAMEALAKRVPMGTDTKSTPRSGGVDVDVIAKSGQYTEDTTANDDVILTAKKFGRAIRIADEDIQDSLANIIDTKSVDWARSYAIGLDNACLGVTATGAPYDSLYYQLTHNGAGSASGYSANANVVNATLGGSGDYDTLSNVVGLVEQGDYFDEGSTVVMAHPSFRETLRDVKDLQGRPIFVQGTAGTPDTLFGLTVKWALGARTSATATNRPTGNPMLIVGNRDYLLLGVRSGPESFFIPANTGLGALTDEAILKMRSRRGFQIGVPQAFSMLVNTPAG